MKDRKTQDAVGSLISSHSHVLHRQLAYRRVVIVKNDNRWFPDARLHPLEFRKCVVREAWPDTSTLVSARENDTKHGALSCQLSRTLPTLSNVSAFPSSVSSLPKSCSSTSLPSLSSVSVSLSTPSSASPSSSPRSRSRPSCPPLSTHCSQPAIPSPLSHVSMSSTLPTLIST